MGHYLSEMDPDWASKRDISGPDTGYTNKELIEDFYSPNSPGTGTPCPVCGVSVKWNWINAGDLIRHIKWHKELKRCINRGYAYPGDEI